MSSTTHVPDTSPVLQRLSTLDRFLPVWIGVAMLVGLVLGRVVPGLDDALAAVEVGSVSLPIAVGLLIMMYPVLAKVRYGELGRVTGDRRLLATSIFPQLGRRTRLDVSRWRGSCCPTSPSSARASSSWGWPAASRWC